MKLWNTSEKEIETMYNGKIVIFAPNERKKFADHLNNVSDHVLYKLAPYGLVQISDEPYPKEEHDALLKGLKARWRMLDSVIRQFRAANAARESKHQPPTPPDEKTSDIIFEAEGIRKKIEEMDVVRIKVIDDYFDRIDKREKEAMEVANSVDKIDVAVSGEAVRKPGRPRKEKVFHVVPPAETPGVSAE